MTDHKLRCMTCKNRHRNPNDDDFCTIYNDWLDGLEIDFIAVVGCASHSDTITSFEKCPDRVVNTIGFADCNNHTGGGLPYICSAKRHHNQCPRGFGDSDE